MKNLKLSECEKVLTNFIEKEILNHFTSINLGHLYIENTKDKESLLLVSSNGRDLIAYYSEISKIIYLENLVFNDFCQLRDLDTQLMKGVIKWLKTKGYSNLNSIRRGLSLSTIKKIGWE